jgi:hypothetical protein
MQEHEHDKLLNVVRVAFIADDYACTKQLSDYQYQLQAMSKSRKFVPFKLHDLVQHDLYKSWRQSPRSRTLILRGATQQTRSLLSWLSPVTIELIHKNRDEDPNSVIAYHFCKRENMPENEHMHTSIARITYQLLEQRPRILQKNSSFDKYVQRVHSEKWRSQHLDTACDVFLDVINHFEQVFLILDRPEECKAGESGLSKLLHVIAGSHCVVKTLVVVDKLRTEDGLPSWAEPGLVDVIDDLDQR